MFLRKSLSISRTYPPWDVHIEYIIHDIQMYTTFLIAVIRSASSLSFRGTQFRLLVTCVHSQCIRLDMYGILRSLYHLIGSKRSLPKTFITEKLQKA